MQKIGKLFLQGLIAVLPVAVTIYVLYWLASSAESLLGGAIKSVISEDLYVPGMGVLAGLLVILGAGILLRVWVFRRIFRWGERVLGKIPLIKSLYGSIRDLMGFFDSTKKKDFDKVVMVDLADTGVRLMGLVTREDFSTLPEGIGSDETVAVYVPMSYQIGGYTVIVRKSKVEPVDMSIEQAMRFTLTAALSTNRETG
jgi:uncharacterized membrane protein